MDAFDSDIHPIVFECIDGAAISKAAICTNGSAGPSGLDAVFECIDGAAISKVAICTNGSAGPSGLDASGWKRLCVSFQSSSVHLCNNLALVTRRICTVYVDQQGLAPFTACDSSGNSATLYIAGARVTATRTMQCIPLTFHPPTVHHLRYCAAEVMTNYIQFCIAQLR